MSRRQRARISRIDSEGHTLGAVQWPPHSGAIALGLVARGDQEGRLLRLASGALVLQLPTGAIATLDQSKAEAMLAAEGRPAHA